MSDLSYVGLTKVFDDGTIAVDDLSLQVDEGEFLVFVGPSGCGKTTTLMMTAGLETPTSGEIHIGGKPVTHVRPKDRDIAMVFQSYALYPHMTVEENIAFGLRRRHLPKAEIKVRVADAARTLDLEPLLKRKPATLSGGQRQRVAMGRAMVRRPLLFLMDEPLSNLDAKLRVQMRAEIKQLQRELGVTTMYVTHDQTEAMTMGDRIAVMHKGLLEQVGSPSQLYQSPGNLFVAEFIGSPGMNLVYAGVEVRDDLTILHLGSSQLILGSDDQALRAKLAAYHERSIVVGFRPESIAAVGDNAEDASLRVEVQHLEDVGSEVIVYFEIDAARAITEGTREIAADVDEVVAETLVQQSKGKSTCIGRLDAESGAKVSVGDRVNFRIDARRLHVFDAESGDAIANRLRPGSESANPRDSVAI
jgi:multiple sugar transport system ATP-binding protein